MFIYFVTCSETKECDWFVAASSPARAKEIWETIPYVHGYGNDLLGDVDVYRVPAIALETVQEGPLEWGGGVVRCA